MTTNNEFKSRALFDFIAEGSNELSFNANEILLITSTSAGNEWWYAQNSSGQSGAIPANYVEVIYDELEPIEKKISVPNTYQNNSAFDINNSNTQMEQKSQEYITSISLDSLPTSDSLLPPSEQSSQLNEQKITTKSSFNSLSSSTINTIPNSSDRDITRNNPSLSSDSVPNSLAMKNITIDQQKSNPQLPFDTVSPLENSQTTSIQQQLNDFMFSTSISQDDSINKTSSSLLISTSNETIKTSSKPNILSSSTADLLSGNSSINKIRTQSNVENISTSSTTKTKKEKNKFFALKRHKPKSDTEKPHLPNETAPESSPKPEKQESDSDDFSDSGSPTQNTSLNSRKQSLGGGDAKPHTKVRFFDKHGIDNYLLHGCKAKSDEHVEIGYDEKEGGAYWLHNPNTPPFTCKVEDPSKGTKLGGLKSFMEYKIHAQIPGSRVVGRRYKQFDWLHEQLINKYRFICVPQLPGKQISGRFEQEFVEERRRQLELWLNRICRHPVLCASFPVQHFISCELTEKNNKEWKGGKRKIEKDELRESSWLHCVTFTNSNLSDSQISSQIDIFAQQQPGLETYLKNLSQGLTKYLEKHTEIYERDMQRIGELFSKLHLVIQVDTITPGSKELSNSMSKVSSSYNGIAELYKTKASEGIRDFNERIQEYIGLLTCFPSILNIQRCATEFMKNLQQRGGSSTISDFNNVIHRNQVLNHVILAEINFFQKEKVNDLNLYMKALLNEQTQFYEKVAAELHNALVTFN